MRAPVAPFKFDGSSSTQQPRALAHADNGRLVFLEELKNAFFLRFAHMLASSDRDPGNAG